MVSISSLGLRRDILYSALSINRSNSGVMTGLGGLGGAAPAVVSMLSVLLSLRMGKVRMRPFRALERVHRVLRRSEGTAIVTVCHIGAKD
jgi:hypothetical protein